MLQQKPQNIESFPFENSNILLNYLRRETAGKSFLFEIFYVDHANPLHKEPTTNKFTFSPSERRLTLKINRTIVENDLNFFLEKAVKYFEYFSTYTPTLTKRFSFRDNGIRFDKNFNDFEKECMAVKQSVTMKMSSQLLSSNLEGYPVHESLYDLYVKNSHGIPEFKFIVPTFSESEFEETYTQLSKLKSIFIKNNYVADVLTYKDEAGNKTAILRILS